MISLSRLQIAIWTRNYRNSFLLADAWSRVIWPSWPVWGET